MRTMRITRIILITLIILAALLALISPVNSAASESSASVSNCFQIQPMSAIIVIVDTKSIQKKKCKKYPSTTRVYMIISVPKTNMQNADIEYDRKSSFFEMKSILMSGYSNLYITSTDIIVTNILFEMIAFMQFLAFLVQWK
jgi:hypothetical protein